VLGLVGRAIAKAINHPPIIYSENDLWLFFEKPLTEEQEEELILAIEKISGQSLKDGFIAHKLISTEEGEQFEAAELLAFGS
jgi:hypothetical protein